MDQKELYARSTLIKERIEQERKYREETIRLKRENKQIREEIERFRAENSLLRLDSDKKDDAIQNLKRQIAASTSRHSITHSTAPVRVVRSRRKRSGSCSHLEIKT